MKQNLHTHSLYCDGNNTLEEMVLSAIEKHFDVLGFSGHGNSRNIDEYSMDDKSVALYCREVIKLKEKYQNQIAIFLGIEQDFLGKRYAHDEFDYIIGSVHVLPVKNNYVCIDQSKETTQNALKYFHDFMELAQTYYECVKQMAYVSDIDVIGHLDLIMKFNEDESFIKFDDPAYLSLAYECIDVLIKQNKIIEVNTGAMAKGYRKSAYPHPLLLKYICDNNGKICLNSDAHDKEKLDYGFNETMKVIKKCGFHSLYALGKNGFEEVALDKWEGECL